MHDSFEALARQAAFRRLHRVGQKVLARMLRAEGPDLAWVSVEGQELLARVAQLPTPARPCSSSSPAWTRRSGSKT